MGAGQQHEYQGAALRLLGPQSGVTEVESDGACQESCQCYRIRRGYEDKPRELPFVAWIASPPPFASPRIPP